MTILIKGMEMPEFGALNIFVLPDGKVLGEVSGQAPLRLNILGTAVPVSTPHGRLIDADAFQRQMYEREFDRLLPGNWLALVNLFLSEAPTIIEAEEG